MTSSSPKWAASRARGSADVRSRFRAGIPGAAAPGPGRSGDGGLRGGRVQLESQHLALGTLQRLSREVRGLDLLRELGPFRFSPSSDWIAFSCSFRYSCFRRSPSVESARRASPRCGGLSSRTSTSRRPSRCGRALRLEQVLLLRGEEQVPGDQVRQPDAVARLEEGIGQIGRDALVQAGVVLEVPTDGAGERLTLGVDLLDPRSAVRRRTPARKCSAPSIHRSRVTRPRPSRTTRAVPSGRVVSPRPARAFRSDRDRSVPVPTSASR